jgi:hypothetical protein
MMDNLDLIGRDQLHRAVGVAHGTEGTLMNDAGAGHPAA